MFFGGLLAGYLAKRRTGSSDGVGVRTGLLGGLPMIWLLVDVLGAASALGGPSWFVAVGLVFTVGILTAITVVGFGLTTLAGAVSGRVGGKRQTVAGR